MKMIAALIVSIIVALIIVACGGGSGGGSSSSPSPVQPPVVRSKPLTVCYFGVSEGQIADTADHVDCVFPMDWGNWDRDQVAIQLRIINQLQEAKARGIRKAVVAVGFLTWTQQGQLKGLTYLETFKTQLEALGLMDMIVAFYPMDEPDVIISNGKITEDNLKQGLIYIHTVFPDKLLMVIYGDKGSFPAISFFDIVGKDKYSSGPQVISHSSKQSLNIVAGGANPYREDPNQYYDTAMRNEDIEYIIFFLWDNFTDPDGHFQLGIKNNGMLPAYKAVGSKIKGQ